MDRNNKRNAELLGMPFGTATNRLRKAVMFELVCRTGANLCFRCGKDIRSVDELSIEHKEPWRSASNPVKSFFDLGNVTFSHLKCNGAAAAKPTKGIPQVGHGTTRYRRWGCRCSVCLQAEHEKRELQQVRTHGTAGYRSGCRCDVCLTATREYFRLYMRNRRQKHSSVAQ